MSYPLFGDDDIKTGSIARPEAPHAAPQGQTAPQDKVTRAPLAPPPGAEAATASQVSAAPSAYAAPQASAAVGETAPALSPADWTYARGALGLAMGAASPNASVPWANPDSGAYGSFTASAAAITQNGALCRPFAASYSMAGREQRLEGDACRTAAGYWEAVSIRPTRAGA
ncbi:hypothetical protein GCM10008171_34510 [Methylopila jiangsuensis]|uniref:Surface antigen domain-containing protein n=1 Tax=Methylopila jiangsuensis TaxID=586230 RepID=A0A9W6JJ85_9HYPH|nr:RT0821/Lpp0805 family surface protein [Methylopila jiangsuensis]MDR6284418.1 surface antigen [Methylopila jiangsuensis]GLK78197.1 hypothetical protein GCM10008171_34510 [Methylopila jiangsuensis]